MKVTGVQATILQHVQTLKEVSLVLAIKVILEMGTNVKVSAQKFYQHDC